MEYLLFFGAFWAVGLILGIKLNFVVGIILSIVALILSNVMGKDKELWILLYWLAALAFIVGIVSGDLYVFFHYPASFFINFNWSNLR